MWADRNFSDAVVKSMYSFHASANSYHDYWNSTFGSSNPANGLKLGRKQVWQAFVQESIRTVAFSDDVDFETRANWKNRGEKIPSKKHQEKVLTRSGPGVF